MAGTKLGIYSLKFETLGGFLGAVVPENKPILTDPNVMGHHVHGSLELGLPTLEYFTSALQEFNTTKTIT
jgi:hypothetical protein